MPNRVMSIGESMAFWRRRRNLAFNVLTDGGNLADVGAAWGTSSAYAVREVRRRWPSLHQKLSWNRPAKGHLTSPQIHARLWLIKHHGVSETARQLGLTSAAISRFKARYVEGDDIDGALAEFSEPEIVSSYPEVVRSYCEHDAA